MLEAICAIILLVDPVEDVKEIFPVASKEQPSAPLSLEGGKTISVTEFVFKGNQAVSTSRLQRITQPYLNTAIGKTDIQNIKQRILFTYRNLGYDKTTITIHEMKQKGVLLIEINEKKQGKN